jgi:hypothetical protein
MALLLDKPGIRHVVEILIPEADEQGALLLARQSGRDLEHARRLIEALCDELVGLTEQ